MADDASPIVVTTGATAHSAQVHHRELPEIRVDGANAKEAAAHLVNQLLRARDSALTKWRLELFDRAIADVKAFIDSAE